MDVNFFTEEWLSWSKASDLKSEVGDELTVGSNPTSSAILRVSRIAAIAGDCKSPGFGLPWFESKLAHHFHRARIN